LYLGGRRGGSAGRRRHQWGREARGRLGFGAFGLAALEDDVEGWRRQFVLRLRPARRQQHHGNKAQMCKQGGDQPNPVRHTRKANGRRAKRHALGRRAQRQRGGIAAHGHAAPRVQAAQRARTTVWTWCLGHGHPA
jgi:hypothetical protein